MGQASPPGVAGFYSLILLMFCVFVATGYSSAVWSVELFRCTLDGGIEFRQTPCPAGRQEKTVVVEQSRGMTPAEPALRLAPPKTAHQNKLPVRDAARKPNEEKCWKLEQKLEKVEQRLRGGYKASQYRSLHRKQDEYEDYLRRFCRP